MEKNVFEHGPYIYIIEKNIYEPDELLYERINYIRDNIDKDSFDNLKRESNLVINKRNYECEYVPEFSFI